MTNFDAAKAIFNQVDTNSDGKIDPNEFRNWAVNNSKSSNNGGYETAFSSQSDFESAGTAVSSSNLQHTTEYTSTGKIYHDPNPQIIRRASTGDVVTYQQKILVRFLQPPPIPPPGVKMQFHLFFLYICFSFYSLLLSKKFVHHNHLHRHHLLFVKKLLLFHNHHPLSYENVLQYHQQVLLVKQVNLKKKKSRIL